MSSHRIFYYSQVWKLIISLYPSTLGGWSKLPSSSRFEPIWTFWQPRKTLLQNQKMKRAWGCSFARVWVPSLGLTVSAFWLHCLFHLACTGLKTFSNFYPCQHFKNWENFFFNKNKSIIFGKKIIIMIVNCGPTALYGNSQSIGIKEQLGL